MQEQPKKPIVCRLKRIEGQIRGLQKMIENDKPCNEVMIQITAAQSALKMVKQKVFEEYAGVCLDEVSAVVENPCAFTPEEFQKLRKRLKTLLEFIGNLLITEMDSNYKRIAEEEEG